MAVNPPLKHKGVARGRGGLHQPVCTFCTIYRVDRFGYNNYVILIVHYIKIYGSQPPRTRAKPRGQGWFTFAINSNVVDNKCYIYRSTHLNEKYLPAKLPRSPWI